VRVSVVIPSYNRAGLLPETLATVLGQTRPADEVIVVDDGSRDSTGEVLAGYAPRVRAIRIENSGDLAARNVGLRAAGGDLVAFCDSDDLWRPEFLERMAALWEMEPGLRAAYSDFVIVRDGAWESAGKFAAAPAGFWDGLRPLGPDAFAFDVPVVDRVVGFQPFFASCVMVERNWFLGAGGWDESVSRVVGGDSATALRIADAPPIGVLFAPLAGIRRHAGNFSGDVQAMNLGDAEVLERLLASRPELGRHADLIRHSIAARRRAGLETAFARGDIATVRRVFRLVPPPMRHGKLRLKRLIAGLPMPLARRVALLLAGI
jgi:glycosyltransferase involved in cell wall biosynthesis